MKYQVMPDLTPIEYEALKADIAEHGVLVPVEVDENGELLDGHHRVKAWQELTEEGCAVAKYPTMRRTGWSEEQKRNHARRLNVLRRQLSVEQQKRVRADMKLDGMSYPAIAEATGASVGKVYADIQEVFKNENLEIPPTKGKDGVEQASTKKPRKPKQLQESMFSPGGAVKLDPVAAEATVKEIREERRAEIREDRVDKVNEIARGNAPLQMPQQYPVIYADPPWRYEHSKTVSREIENQYPTMSLEEICELPVNDLAAQDAVLFLWTTSPKLEEAFAVIPSWGFTYRTCMVWDKERIGMGYYARQQHELLLICTRGELPAPEPANRPRSVQRIPRDLEHSAKPEEFRCLIERMYPEYDRIELFARTNRDGWATWGNQA